MFVKYRATCFFHIFPAAGNNKIPLVPASWVPFLPPLPTILAG
jgi:hypothetical protein